ncbi:hypothetical protein BSK53_13145 [Paenibacillus odorifer]|nr:hypothetical protein BSK53_13145 [Paenibacillus odorifer]
MFGDAESEMWEMGYMTCKFAECEMRCVEMRMWKCEMRCVEMRMWKYEMRCAGTLNVEIRNKLYRGAE